MQKYVLFIALVSTIGWVGCDSPTEPDAGPASATLSFVVGSASLTKSLAGHVTVSSAKVMLKTIQFHSVDDNDSLDFNSEPLVVDLDLTGGVTTVGPIEIPVGSYDKVSFRLHKPDDGEDGLDSDFYEVGGSDRYSVVVAGTHADTTFVFKSQRGEKQRLEFDPPIVVTDTTTSVNVTLSVDVDSWFVNFETNANLNPSDADDESDIDDAIRESFRGFEDNDKSGD